MRPIAPRVAHDGETMDEIMVAEEQAGLSPICAAVLPHADGTRTLLTRWTLTSRDRERIAAGGDLFIGFQNTMRPFNVSVGPDDWHCALAVADNIA